MKHTRKLRRLNSIALALILFSAAATPTNARQRPQRGTNTGRVAVATPATPPSQKKRPKLVLLIAVDQLRYDYLERFGDLFAPNGGLRRLMRDGASWTDANYDHIPTETAPGHATLMTGTWPSEHGIIGNEWYDRDTGKRVMNTSDASARLLGGTGDPKEEGASPRRMLASTVGDELRLATNGRAKVVGISVKDRGAILPAGRHASAAYWFNSPTGRFVSSTYYFNQLPAWVARFNETKPADKYFGAKWEKLLTNDAEYVRRAGADDAAWENTGSDKDRDTKTFPHTIWTGGASAPDGKFYDALITSPFVSDILVEFAKQAITNESLGADEETDVLTVGFSSNDYVGHRFGPYSHEVMDITLRLDRQIGALLDFVEARVGLQNTVVVLSADHGVAPVPEHAASLNLPGVRLKPADIRTAITNAIKTRYDRAGDDKDSTADYVLDYTPKNGQIYFNPVALKRDGVSLEEIERVAGEAAMTVPGVSRYFTRTQLERGAISPNDAVARRVLHGFDPRRGGDLVVITEAFNLVVTYTADHFSPYSYDTHVPVIIMNPQHVEPGRYTQPATPADIAPTLSAILRVVKPSNATGRVLIEGLKK